MLLLKLPFFISFIYFIYIYLELHEWLNVWFAFERILVDVNDKTRIIKGFKSGLYYYFASCIIKMLEHKNKL